MKKMLCCLALLSCASVLLVGCYEPAARTISSDEKLDLVVSTHQLRPLHSKDFYVTERYKLGQALFFDPILSGNRDVSCATCHLIKFGTSDGLSLSIGVGGKGIGTSRKSIKSREIHPRNSLDLFNRDHNDVRSMFWDGRVEMIDPSKRHIRSPLGADLPIGFDNAMAAQAVFPLLTPNEMLGYDGDVSDTSLSDAHAGIHNELVNGVGDPLASSRVIFKRIIKRLIGNPQEMPKESWQKEYRRLISEAYPGMELESFSIVEVGNSLAHFEEIAFATRQAAWDNYLKGNRDSLSQEQKIGAILFYGKARCAACHSGQIFSDFQYHSVGVIDTDERIVSENRDLGRFAVTGREEDKFKFRTPPLRNVKNTAPYFHNGSAKDLYEVIEHHNDPMVNANKYHESGRFLLTGTQADSVSPILQVGLNLSDREIGYLVSFLDSLSYEIPEEDLVKIIPNQVPSALDVIN